jgi:hypothetical protein
MGWMDGWMGWMGWMVCVMICDPAQYNRDNGEREGDLQREAEAD